MSRYLLISLLLLAACATPREQCITEATENLRVLDGLIAETRANLDRGYAIRREHQPTMVLTFCATPDEHFQFCNRRTTRVVERPEAIDLAEERRKLASLTQRRAEEAARAQSRVQACDAAHPEA